MLLPVEFTIDSPVVLSDSYTSKDTDACAKRSVIDHLSVVFSCSLGSFAAKTLFHLKNLFINNLFSFFFLYFCRAFAINAFVNNNFDMNENS